MKIEEAYELLHPDTSRDAVMRIKEHGGDGLKAVEEACVVACEALEKLMTIKKLVDRYDELDKANKQSESDYGE